MAVFLPLRSNLKEYLGRSVSSYAVYSALKQAARKRSKRYFLIIGMNDL